MNAFISTNATSASSASHTIVAGDTVFATLEVGGSVVARLTSSRFTSIEEVVKAVMRSAGAFMGLGKLSIRNKSQGWRTCTMLNRRHSSAAAFRPLAMA